MWRFPSAGRIASGMSARHRVSTGVASVIRVRSRERCDDHKVSTSPKSVDARKSTSSIVDGGSGMACARKWDVHRVANQTGNRSGVGAIVRNSASSGNHERAPGADEVRGVDIVIKGRRPAHVGKLFRRERANHRPPCKFAPWAGRDLRRRAVHGKHHHQWEAWSCERSFRHPASYAGKLNIIGISAWGG